MKMVTWTFDLNALLIGIFIGMVVGSLIALCIMMRTGGSWSIGFNDGCHLKRIVERLERLVETKEEE
jgi:gas vesicle protein